MRKLIVVMAMGVAFCPMVARAGDAPIFVMRGYGIGEMDGDYLLYLGRGRSLITPVPVPRGKRGIAKWMAVVGGGVGVVVYWRRRGGGKGNGFPIETATGVK